MKKPFFVGSVVLAMIGVAHAGEQAPSWLHQEQVTHYDGHSDDLQARPNHSGS